MTRFRVLLVAAIFGSACGPSDQLQPPAVQPRVDDRVKALADAYLDGYFERNPEQGTYYGVPGRHHDRLTDNSLNALRAWEAREDGWLSEAKAIDETAIGAAPLRATYAIVREALEGAVASRVCRNELWNVSQMTGWHVQFGYLVTIQPVGTDPARAEALARWRSLPAYLETIGSISGGRWLTERPFSDPPARPPGTARIGPPWRADYGSSRWIVNRAGRCSAGGSTPLATPPARRRPGHRSGTSGTGVEHRAIGWSSCPAAAVPRWSR